MRAAPDTTPITAERLRYAAAGLRELVAQGLRPATYLREAERLEALAREMNRVKRAA